MINKARFIRFFNILGEKGPSGVAAKLRESLKRDILNPYYHLYYLDMSSTPVEDIQDDELLIVARYNAFEEIPPGELDDFYSYRDRRYAEESLRNRFGKGSHLWILKEDGRCVGFIWSVVGKTMKNHFFRLMKSDVYIFDTEIFLPFRGRGLNKVLLRKMLREITSACKPTGRLPKVYGDTKTWNFPMQKTLKAVGFSYMGTAAKFSAFNKTVVIWKNSLEQKQY